MMRKFLLVSIVLILGFALGMVSWTHADRSKDPDEVIEYLHLAIEEAHMGGDYNCCIQPACTMCYLGHWKFEKGTCHCDDAIKEGRDEDICPECKKGLEDGNCNSLENDTEAEVCLI